MWIVAAGIIGFLMDCIIGDPASLPHPVRFIGWWISTLEKAYRGLFRKTPKGEGAAGACMAVTVLLITGGTGYAALWAGFAINKWIGFAVACIMSWQAIAAKCLKDEASKVQLALEKDDLPAARRQIAMLVGRDTENLDSEQVAKAAVETVAENTSDGVVAPLFWLMLGGPVAGMLYKSVNTMDSMVGYKNSRYMYFGTFCARLDDLLNYLPARLTALFMVVSAFLGGYDGKGAWKIWKRDRRNHSSPNSAHPESACAGALNIRLAGNASYFGQVCTKPYIGDPIRAVAADDIKKSCRLMYLASTVALIVFSAVRLMFILISIVL